MDSWPDIFAKADQYLGGTISFDDLEDWFIPLLPDFFSRADGDSSAELAAVIEMGRAELSSEIIDEQEFKHMIQSFLRSLETVRVETASLRTGSGSVNATVVTLGSPSISQEFHATVGRILF